ncbi:MAG: hypothetical protein AAGC68_03780, partial [Verrucomicrobiota bacterium]
MKASSSLYLGFRHLRRNKTKTGLLVSALTLVWLLPGAISVLVHEAESHLRERAIETPLVLGHAGSALELTFNAIYFTKPGITTLAYGEMESVFETGFAEAIPLYVRFRAGESRVVGTSLDYFRFRNFEFSEGRTLLRLGECEIPKSKIVEAGTYNPRFSRTKSDVERNCLGKTGL